MPRRPALGLVIALLAAVVAAPAPAQEPAQTTLVLQETALREVEQDTLVATVTARTEARTAREAQDAVNAAMTAAIEETRAVEGISRATGGYRVYQERDREGRTGPWIAEQDLRLRAPEAGPLLELVGSLQGEGLVLNGLAYELSAEARRQLESELTIEAIERLRERARQIAASMAMQVARIETLRVGGVNEPPVRPMMQARAEAASMAPPVALPDRETVEVSVDADVVLTPADGG